MKSSPLSLTVIVPCKNESLNIENLVKRLDKAAEYIETKVTLCVINDGSSDTTGEKFNQTETRFIQKKIINSKTSLGIYESWKSGIQHADTKVVALMDGDLQNRPEDIFHLLENYLNHTAEVIQGRRINLEGLERSRSILSKGLARLLRLISGTTLSDPKSGFLLGDREAFATALPLLNTYKYPQTFIGITIEKLGYSIREIPTGFDKRVAGESFLNGKYFFTITQSILDVFIRYPRQRIKSRTGRDTLKGWTALQKLHLRIYFASMPLHAWIIRSSSYKKFLELMISQWDSSEKIMRRREIRLREILLHAEKNTNWYGKSLSNKNGPTSDWDLLKGVQLLEKDQIKVNGPVGFMDFNHPHVTHKIATSGSTGSPMVIFADREQLEWRFAATLRALTWTDWKMGKKQLRLWHQKIGMTQAQVFKEKLDAFLLRRKFVPAFEFTENKIVELYEFIRKYKPFIIDGYAESLDYLTKHHVSIDHKTGAIMSSAQTLTTQVRAKLEKELTHKVYDKYGSREFSGIAYECGKGPWFHVVSECYIVEILDDQLHPVRPGQSGEIVITDLLNKAMPMIRYRIGDIGTAIDETVPCECGRKSQRIGAILGRTAALIVTPKGRTLPGTFFAHFFKDYEEIVNHYQVVQVEPLRATLKVVKGRSWNEVAFQDLLTHLDSFMDGLPTDIDFVTSIPLGRTGKRSPVVSLIN